MKRIISLLVSMALLCTTIPAQAIAVLVKQSSTAIPIPFLEVDAATGQIGQTGKAGSITVKVRYGSTTVTGGGTISEVDSANLPGIYAYTPTATETGSLGIVYLHATCTGCQVYDTSAQIVAFDPNDGAAMGLTSIATAATQSTNAATFAATAATQSTTAATQATSANTQATAAAASAATAATRVTTALPNAAAGASGGVTVEGGTTAGNAATAATQATAAAASAATAATAATSANTQATAAASSAATAATQATSANTHSANVDGRLPATPAAVSDVRPTIVVPR